MAFIKKYLLLVLFTIPFSGVSQTVEYWESKAEEFLYTNADSSIYYYKKLIEHAVEPKDSSHLAIAYSTLLSIYKMKNDLQNVDKYAQLLYTVSEQPKYKLGAIIGMMNLAVHENLSLADSLIKEAEHLIPLVKNTNLIATTYNNISIAEKKMGDLYSAIDANIKALDYTESDLLKVTCHSNTALLFLTIKNYPRAEEYILKAKKISDQNQYKSKKLVLALNHADVLHKLKRYDEAIRELNMVINDKSSSDNPKSLAVAYQMQSIIYRDLGEKERAEQCNQKALRLSDNINPITKNSILLNSCRFLMDKKKYRDVIQKTEEVIATAKKMNTPDHIKDAESLRAKAFEKLGQSKLALQAIKNFNSIRDSIFEIEKIIQVNYLEAKYNRKEQESSIALLGNQNTLQSIKLSQQKKILTVGGIALFIISCLLFFLYRLFQKTKAQQSIILNALNEKDTLLREIHHRVKNNLQLVSSLLSLQSRHISDPNTLEVLNSGKSRIKSMALIHQDLYNKESLTGVSVKDYFEKLCNELISTYQINTNKIKLHTEIQDLELDVDTLIPLGLIINELLTNALKYAFPDGRSGQIKVVLLEKENQLHLEISDNGIGMNQQKKQENSFGYKLINTLLYQLQGEMQQTSENGTQLYLSFNYYKIAA